MSEHGEDEKETPLGGQGSEVISRLSFAFSRRTAMAGAALLPAFATYGCSKPGDEHETMAEVDRLKLIQRLADIAIPATDTAGAGTMETAQWVDRALAQGMRGGSLATLGELNKALDEAAPGADFRSAASDRQAEVVAVLDRALPVTPPSSLPPWAIVKSLIFRAYYTSEVGASQELRYEIDPGRYDPSVPVENNMRALSTDQNARYLA